MKFRYYRRWLASVALLAGIASGTAAQTVMGTIKVGTGAEATLPGSPFTSGAAITVNVGTVNDEVLIRLFDVAESADIGRVTVTGTLGTGTGNKRLSVLVASGAATFPERTIDPLPIAGINWAGIEVTDAALRDNTRIAAAINGDLTGSVVVGHVFRLQARATFSGSTWVSGGRILAPVTATAPNNAAVTGTGVIDPGTGLEVFAAPLAFLQAGHLIDAAAPITATQGSIDSIRVQPSEFAAGIQGNIPQVGDRRRGRSPG